MPHASTTNSTKLMSDSLKLNVFTKLCWGACERNLGDPFCDHTFGAKAMSEKVRISGLRAELHRRGYQMELLNSGVVGLLLHDATCMDLTCQIKADLPEKQSNFTT